MLSDLHANDLVVSCFERWQIIWRRSVLFAEVFKRHYLQNKNPEVNARALASLVPPTTAR